MADLDPAAIKAKHEGHKQHPDGSCVVVTGIDWPPCEPYLLAAEVDRLRAINHELVETHNVYLGHVSKVEQEKMDAWAEVERLRAAEQRVRDLPNRWYLTALIVAPLPEWSSWETRRQDERVYSAEVLAALDGNNE